MSRLLPQHASLRQLRLQAKDLLRAYQSREVDTISRLRAALPRLAHGSDADVVAASCSLQDIQYVIAREYGFDDWTALRSHVDTPAGTPGGWAVHCSRPDLEDRLRDGEPRQACAAAGRTRLKPGWPRARLSTRRARSHEEIIGKGMATVEQTLLQACAAAGRTQIGALLAGAKARLDLHAAAFLGKREVVEAKHDAGQGVDVADAFGMTALYRVFPPGDREADRVGSGADRSTPWPHGDGAGPKGSGRRVIRSAGLYRVFMYSTNCQRCVSVKPPSAGFLVPYSCPTLELPFRLVSNVKGL